MKRMLPALLAGLLLGAAPSPAAAAGAWNTYLHATVYNDLLATRDTVWCATGDAGLLIFDRTASDFVPALRREPGGLASNRLTSLAVDRTGRLWIGTSDKGVSRLSADHASWGLVNKFDGLPSVAINVLEADGDSVWIGTDSGIALWDGSQIAGALPDGVNPSPFASDNIVGIVVRADSQFIATSGGMYLRRRLPGGGDDISTINGGLLSTTIQGLASDGYAVFARVQDQPYLFNFSTGQWQQTGGVGAVYRIRDGNGLITLTSSLGVYRWTGIQWTLLSGSPVSGNAASTILAAAADSTGRRFVANGAGLYEEPAAPGAWMLHTPEGPPGNVLINLAMDGPRIYAITFDQGVGRFDGTRWRNWFPTPASCQTGCDTTFLNPLFSIAALVDEQGRKWIGCWSVAMEIFDDSVSPPQFVRPTYPPGEGINPERHTFAVASALDSTYGHWFGMDTPDLGNPELAPIGLDYYDATGAWVANYRPENTPSMPGGKIRGLAVDRRGRVWVGYSGQGVAYFDVPALGDQLDLHPVTGTSSLDVQGMAAIGDTLWVFANNELQQYSAATAQLKRSFPVPAGSAGNFAIYPLAVARDGSVWLGTVIGIRVYEPDGRTRADYTTANSPLASDEVRSIRINPSTGLAWIATAAGLNSFDPGYVPPPPPQLARLDARVYPNPAPLSAIGVSLSVLGNASDYRGEIYDLSGRVLRRFSGVGNRRMVWNGRDGDGRVVRPGIYFIRFEAGGRTSVARVVLLR